MNRRFITAILATIVLSLGVFSAEDAHAEGAIWGGLAGANLNALDAGGLWGVGGQAGMRLSVGEFWSVFADVGGSYHFEKIVSEELTLPGTVVTQLAAGLRYNLDVFTYIPYVGLGGTFYLDVPPTGEESVSANAGLKAVFGVDWRPAREWSLGLFGEIHALVSDLGRYPIYSQVGLNGTYYFRW